jgi:hypothetical protein
MRIALGRVRRVDIGFGARKGGSLRSDGWRQALRRFPLWKVARQT